jgi:hypothetical protein
MASTPALSSEALRAYILHSLLYFPSKGKGILMPCLSIAPVYNLGQKDLDFYPIDLGYRLSIVMCIEINVCFAPGTRTLHKLQEY